MLEVDHSLRITAKEALDHPYLKSLKENTEKTKEINSKKLKGKK